MDKSEEPNLKEYYSSLDTLVGGSLVIGGIMISNERESIIQLDDAVSSAIPRVTDDSKLLEVEPSCAVKSRLVIEFTDLSYSVGCRKAGLKQKEILRSVSGHFRPGRLTAILGPSGAGKTTLLSIISGLRGSNVKGSITVNGVERRKEIYGKQACYIPQEFALLPLLTVQETLKIAADLKLGSTHTAERKKRAVNDVAKKLGLLPCLDTAAGNLSGGERKRLSIGVELISNPPIMLLDEPTSGLDSAASAQVISVLHTLTEGGHTVVCTVHQPGSKLISLFHDIVVLSQGRIIYCGPRDEILETFACAGYRCPQLYNLAEFVLETVTETKDNLDRLVEVCRKRFEENKLRLRSSTVAKSKPSSDYLNQNEDRVPQTGRYSTSEWRQFTILFNRAIICSRRDHTLTKLRVTAHIGVGILIGIVFYNFGDDAARIQSNTACIFTALLFLFFGNSMPAVQMFPIEAVVFLREHLNNWYSLQSYYIAKVLADIPLQVLCPTCFLVFAYWLTGQPLEIDRIWRVWLICILLTMLAQSFGIAAGAACGAQCGVFLVPALNIPMFLFAGFFVKIGEVSSYLKPVCFISYFRYAFEGFLQGIYGNSRKVLPCSEDFCPLRSPSAILSHLGMPTSPFYVMILVLIAWISVLHICVYTVFRWKLHRATK